MKTCSRCKESKGIEEFHKNSSRCKPCAKEYNKEWQARDPEKAKDSWRRSYHKTYDTKKNRVRRYGLSVDEFDQLVESQNGCCKICNLEKPLQIDHCHETGRIRGLLCFQCNTAIGLLYERVDLMQNAINYMGL